MYTTAFPEGLTVLNENNAGMFTKETAQARRKADRFMMECMFQLLNI